MKIIALIENKSSDRKYEAEHGLSIYIDTGLSKILVDTGKSGDFIDNAKEMGIAIVTVGVNLSGK